MTSKRLTKIYAKAKVSRSESLTEGVCSDLYSVVLRSLDLISLYLIIFLHLLLDRPISMASKRREIKQKKVYPGQGVNG